MYAQVYLQRVKAHALLTVVVGVPMRLIDEDHVDRRERPWHRLHNALAARWNMKMYRWSKQGLGQVSTAFVHYASTTSPADFLRFDGVHLIADIRRRLLVAVFVALKRLLFQDADRSSTAIQLRRSEARKRTVIKKVKLRSKNRVPK